METNNESTTNEEVIETARVAWNELTILFGEGTEACFDTDEKEAFKVFYKSLVETLFEDMDTEGN